jgi:hypothetical protein
MPATAKRPGPGRTGRPTRLAQLVDDGNGGTCTVADRIVAIIRDTGCTSHQAASAAKVDRLLFNEWWRSAALAEQRIINPKHGGPPATKTDHELHDFAHRCHDAFVGWHQEMRGILLRLARGETDQTVVTVVRDHEGHETRTVTRRNAMPDARVLERLLAVTLPEQYHLPTVIELAVPEGGSGAGNDTELAPGMGLVENLRAALDRKREAERVLPEGVIDTTARDTDA